MTQSIDVTVPQGPIVVEASLVGSPGPPGEDGDPGPPGPTGPPGSGNFAYVHDQSAPSATWVVVHNLGGFPNLTCVDSAGTVVIGAEVYDSANQITVSFTLPVTGKAYVS